MRTRRRTILLAALLSVTLLTGLAWLILRNQEPVYQGKGLRAWLQEPISSEGGVDTNELQAIRQIGTNAIPTLLRMLRAHDSKFKLKFVGLAQKQHFIKINFIDAKQQKSEALFAFIILGASASNAVPALIQIYEARISEVSQMATAEALAAIGPASNAAVPALLRTAADTNADANVRVFPARVFGGINANAELVIPVLIKCLQDTEPGVRRRAAAALCDFDHDAKEAVPALVGLLKDRDPFVRQEAGEALKAIDPEAATKAGIK